MITLLVMVFETKKNNKLQLFFKPFRKKKLTENSSTNENLFHGANITNNHFKMSLFNQPEIFSYHCGKMKKCTLLPLGVASQQKFLWEKKEPLQGF